MKYTRVSQSHENAMRLQSIGFVLGTPAKEIKKGSNLMWNFGTVSQVIDIIKETEKTITISTSYEGKTYERKLLKTRLVCILEEAPKEEA